MANCLMGMISLGFNTATERNMRKGIIVGLAILLIAGCEQGDAKRSAQLQEQVEQLQSQVKTLQTALDEERNGPLRLLAKGRQQLQDGDLPAAKQTLERLIKKYPERAEAEQARPIISEANRRLAEVETQKKLEQSRKAEEERQALARLDKNLTKSTDEIREITWVSHKTEPILSKKMSLYFGTRKGNAAGMPLRLKFQYYDDDWLFVRGLTIKADDKVFTLPGVEFKRDNGSGSIWEWSYEPVSDFAMLDAVLAAKKVIIRFEGQQYYSDFVLPNAQKVAMKEVLLAWERYGGVRK
ncbi:TPA: hypothetical protein NJF88_002859 [Pseudomonas aeruginosa]|nr:hypothetical protein [Pseudomonas aeruginosa]